MRRIDSVRQLTYGREQVDAIVECIRNSAADNQVFNVVDRDRVTKKTYMERVVNPLSRMRL